MTSPSGYSAASGASNNPQTVRKEATASTRAPAMTPGHGSNLETSEGRTTIAETVGLRSRRTGHTAGRGGGSVGGGAARAMGAVRERIPGARASSSQGVTVEVGERQAAVDLIIVVEYGVAIVELARAIRRNVITSIEQMTGLEVVEVNVSVVDLQLPGQDTGEGQPRQPGHVDQLGLRDRRSCRPGPPATAPVPIGREIDRRVDPIVSAVLACPLVAGLHGGRKGEAVTFLPGGGSRASAPRSTRWPSMSSPTTPRSWTRSLARSGARSRPTRPDYGSTWSSKTSPFLWGARSLASGR